MIRAPAKQSLQDGILSLGPAWYAPADDGGGLLRDVVGSRHFTPTGTPLYRQPTTIAGAPYGIYLGGSAYFTAIADATPLHPLNSMSFSIWVKQGAVSADRNIWLSSSNDMRLYIDSSNLIFMRRYGVANEFNSSAAFSDTTSWHHMGWEKMGATYSACYLDGVSQAITNYASQTYTSSATAPQIGTDGGSSNFTGWIAQVALFNRPIGPAGFAYLYSLGRGD